MSREKLCINFNNIDYSLPMSDFIRRDTTLNILTTDYFYVGFDKPLNQFFFSLNTPNTLNTTITTVEQYNGTTWNNVDNLEDNTYGLSESGYICWEQFDCDTKCVKTTIGLDTKYWYRFSFSEDITVTFNAIGVLFSSDADVYIEYPILDNPKYKTSVSGNTENYTNIHVQVRDYILSDIRSTGINKYTEGETAKCAYFKQITEFDLFNLEEVRFAARMLAMSMIYYKLSDSVDDRWQIDAERYKAEYLRAFNVAFMSIDKNDDGKQDVCEQPTFKTNLRINR